jgi:ribosomal protein S18 acetylase RimI-like enzyme
MGSKIRIREADRTDRDLLVGFHRSLYQQHRDRVVPACDLPLIDYHEYDRVLRDDVGALLSDPSCFVLIAEAGELPIGYVTGRVTVESQRVLPRRGVVEDWYVVPESRGTGVGKLLLCELEKRFVDRGCQVIESATWAGNAGTRKVHEALGFHEIRVIYRKRLSSSD